MKTATELRTFADALTSLGVPLSVCPNHLLAKMVDKDTPKMSADNKTGRFYVRCVGTVIWSFTIWELSRLEGEGEEDRYNRTSRMAYVSFDEEKNSLHIGEFHH